MINTDILYTKFIEHVGQRKSGYFGLSTSEGIGRSMNRVAVYACLDSYLLHKMFCLARSMDNNEMYYLNYEAVLHRI